MSGFCLNFQFGRDGLFSTTNTWPIKIQQITQRVELRVRRDMFLPNVKAVQPILGQIVRFQEITDVVIREANHTVSELWNAVNEENNDDSL